jgi:hypothetical protein
VFNQSKIARSVAQAQDIFNKYIYETTDTRAQVQAIGYFAACRFAQIDSPDTNGNGWHRAVIEANCSDGYLIGSIDGSTGTLTATLPAADPLGVLQLSITYPITPAAIVVVGTGNASLQPPTGFYSVLGHYLPVLADGVTLSATGDGQALLSRDALLVVTAYLDVSHSMNNSTVGVVFRVDRGGSIFYSGRSVHAKMPNNGDIGNISGVGVLQALAGDKIGVAVASDNSGTITIQTSAIVLQALT